MPIRKPDTLLQELVQQDRIVLLDQFADERHESARLAPRQSYVA